MESLTVEAAGAQVVEAFRPRQLVQWPSGEQQAARLQVVERFDAFVDQRKKLAAIANYAEEWAGLPIGIEGEKLVVDPSYRWAHIFNGERADPEKDLADEGFKIRNIFWSARWRCRVAIVEKDGEIWHQPIIGTGNSADMEISTLGCSFAWGIEQESKALQLLGTLLKHHAFKCYLLTGMFLESSERSGVTYLFRKLRPTVAMTANRAHGKMSILCAMCMHPIGYYSGSWAGAMCPTDDVIAHLMLMRGDEPMFWRRCNQHDPRQPEAGL